MTPGHHRGYTIFNVDEPFLEDLSKSQHDILKQGKQSKGEDPSVVNVLINGVFAYLYHVIASDSAGCLNWLLPEEEGDAGLACVRLGHRKVFKDASSNEEFSLLGPVIVATIAYFVKCTPWHTFHGVIEKPQCLRKLVCGFPPFNIRCRTKLLPSGRGCYQGVLQGISQFSYHNEGSRGSGK